MRKRTRKPTSLQRLLLFLVVDEFLGAWDITVIPIISITIITGYHWKWVVNLAYLANDEMLGLEVCGKMMGGSCRMLILCANCAMSHFESDM
jgi:hypothetical protein